MTSKRDLAITVLTVLIGITPLIIQFYRTGDTASLTVAGILLVALPIYFIFDWVTNKFGLIDSLGERVLKLEEKTDYMKEVHALDKRISIVERNGKGAINPKYIVFGVMVLLFILYLRTAGFI
ncbi:MAG: hypothetical protein HY366_00980 [Candidatus Aenigmarchaeota archaeon]|nr:hypothetical protein [Candidatus Aenigmarchaeota archaeon]